MIKVITLCAALANNCVDTDYIDNDASCFSDIHAPQSYTIGDDNEQPKMDADKSDVVTYKINKSNNLNLVTGKPLMIDEDTYFSADVNYDRELGYTLGIDIEFRF